MTVLFSDIRGFTAVTEKGNPEELVAQLNEYFSRMVAIVFQHKGTVDKFVGDMVMALFGAPLDDPDHAEHAVAAAVEMVRELGELNSKWAAEGRPSSTSASASIPGDMIAGNIGSSSIMSYTVIGDNVNLGSRLESLNKDYATRIIISDATRSLLRGAVRNPPAWRRCRQGQDPAGRHFPGGRPVAAAGGIRGSKAMKTHRFGSRVLVVGRPGIRAVRRRRDRPGVQDRQRRFPRSTSARRTSGRSARR